MSKIWVNTNALKKNISEFFVQNRSDISYFGSTVNQCFEAFVFSSVVSWYAQNGWEIEFIHPPGAPSMAKLKYNTMGRPDNYTYAVCRKDGQCVQVRHGLRVATKSHKAGQSMPANIVLDVAVIGECDLSTHKTNDHVDNADLVTFAEAKHMSAFAELVAGFLGLVHEIAPKRLRRTRPYIGPMPRSQHPAPFLFVSGHLYPTARGLVDTIRERGYDIDVYDCDQNFLFGLKLSTMPAPKGRAVFVP